MTDRKLNLTMLCDYYELTMGNGYFDHGMGDKITYFDVFTVRIPITAALPSLPDLSRWSNISRTCTLTTRI